MCGGSWREFVVWQDCLWLSPPCLTMAQIVRLTPPHLPDQPLELRPQSLQPGLRVPDLTEQLPDLLIVVIHARTIGGGAEINRLKKRAQPCGRARLSRKFDL